MPEQVWELTCEPCIALTGRSLFAANWGLAHCGIIDQAPILIHWPWWIIHLHEHVQTAGQCPLWPIRAEEVQYAVEAQSIADSQVSCTPLYLHHHSEDPFTRPRHYIRIYICWAYDVVLISLVNMVWALQTVCPLRPQNRDRIVLISCVDCMIIMISTHVYYWIP